MFCHVIWGTDILFETLTLEMLGWVWKTPFAHNAFGAWDFMQSLSSFLIFLVVTCTLCLAIYDSFRFG